MVAPVHAHDSTRPDPAAHLTAAMLDRLRGLLLEEREERLAASAVALDGADPDTLERELADTMTARNAAALAEIDAALARIDDGTYGRCERCGVAIPFERLEAMPRARRCVGCPEQGTGSLFG